MTRPLAIDLFCGLGGWTEGLLAEGYLVVGFDNARHVYGEARYPAQLVIQDVLTLHGSQFRDAALIVASPPCQAYSYRAMPWKRAKALPPPSNELFEACFRIQREACEAAGHHIPLVVENVCGAQKWVGRARWHYGSFYLWGDVPALMPITRKAIKVPTMGAGWYPPDHPKHVRGLAFNGHAERELRRRTDVGNGVRFTSRDCGIEKDRVCDCGHLESQHEIKGLDYNEPCSQCSCINPQWTGTAWRKNTGGSWFAIAHNTTSGHSQNPDGRLDGVKVAGQINIRNGHSHTRHLTNPSEHGMKGIGIGSISWGQGKDSRHPNDPRNFYSKSPGRRAASAHIAKIPYELARHIARAWKPMDFAAMDESVGGLRGDPVGGNR